MPVNYPAIFNISHHIHIITEMNSNLNQAPYKHVLIPLWSFYTIGSRKLLKNPDKSVLYIFKSSPNFYSNLMKV